MLLNPPATVGMPLDQVDTPALLLDLDAFEFNLNALDRSLTGKAVRVRPHAKSHKCPSIAKIQMQRGAVGVCCQKVTEAEAMVDGGIDDVLVSNEIVGAAKLARLAQLAKRAHVSVLADDAQNVSQIEAAAAAAGARIHVLVEVDVGAGRCGVLPGEAAAQLAAHIAKQPHLRFAGIHAYQGAAQHLRTPAEREQAIARAVAGVRESVRAIEAVGLRVEIVTGAGTGTYLLEAGSGVYNEIQPGSYVFMDADYNRNLDSNGRGVSDFKQSLFVLSTVMSRPTVTRAVVDAGLKAHSVDSGMPIVAEAAGVRYLKASDEHGVLELDASSTALPLGAKVKLVPGHCDPTVNLHDWLVGYRRDRVEAIWAIAARGAMF